MAINSARYAAAFKAADTDNSGKIDKEELKNVLEQLGKQHGEAEVDAMFAKVDSDQSGLIDEKEFLQFMYDVDNAWIRVQKKTFTRWANTVLSQRMLKLETCITVDLRDGVLLHPLIEILSKKSIGKINQKPKMRLQKLENINKCLHFLQYDGIRLVNIGADDLEEGNEKITLGLIWMLIIKYHIGDSLQEGSPKWLLLEWVKRQIAPYNLGFELKNFKAGWSDGKVLSALTDSLGGDMHQTIDCKNIDPDHYAASAKAMDIAEETFEIPKIMDAPDIVENPEEHSIMTYVSYFRDWADNMANKASGSHSTISGPGVEGGDSRMGNAPFTIVTRNMMGKQCTGGDGSKIAVTVTGPDGDCGVSELKDNGDGTYDGSYAIAKPGDYVVDVKLSNAPLNDSPFNVHFEAGNAANSYAEGPGLQGGKTSQPMEFTIYSVDAEGNRVSTGGDPFAVTIDGPEGNVDFTYSDNGDGTYGVGYQANKGGNYTINVSLFEAPIQHSPYTATVKQAPCAAMSWCDGPGLQGAFDNRPTYFTVHAVDEAGEAVCGDDCSVRMYSTEGNNDVPVSVVDNGDGTYTCNYAAEQAGNFTVEVKLDGDDVKDTPVNVRVTEGADCSQRAECNFTVTFHARNKFGDLKKEGGDEFVGQIMGPNDMEVVAQTSDNGDGSYTCKYTLVPSEGEEPTPYQVTLALNGDHIRGSPYTQYL